MAVPLPAPGTHQEEPDSPDSQGVKEDEASPEARTRETVVISSDEDTEAEEGVGVGVARQRKMVICSDEDTEGQLLQKTAILQSRASRAVPLHTPRVSDPRGASTLTEELGLVRAVGGHPAGTFHFMGFTQGLTVCGSCGLCQM